ENVVALDAVDVLEVVRVRLGAVGPALLQWHRDQAAFAAGAAAPFRYLSRKSRIAFQPSIWFFFLENPCPSSAKTTYSTGIPFFLAAATMSSDSGLMTRGSLAPWRTIRGLLILSAWKSGETASSISRSFTGSPISV